MQSIWMWGGFGVLMTALGAAWGQIRGFWGQVASRVIVHSVVQGTAAGAMASYLCHNFSLSRYSQRHYTAFFIHVRPLKRICAVGVALPSSTGLLFWKGWCPIWLKTNAKDGSGAVTYGDYVIYTVTFFRWTFDADQLVQTALDWINDHGLATDEENGSEEAPKKRRFQLIHCGGTAGHDFILKDGSDGPAQAGSSLSSAKMVQNMGHLLRWKLDQLGTLPENKTDPILDLVLPPQAEEAVERLKHWVKSQSWFREHRIPWKGGWLLHGRPGSGKSCLAVAVGMLLDVPIFVYDLSTYRNDELRKDWRQMTSQAPCIALLEDLDATFNGRESLGRHLTFDCLLNCLDGAERMEGVFVIITTNRLEQIDEALGGQGTVRPGRVDRVIEMPLLDKAGQTRIAERILKEWPELIPDVLESLPDQVSGAICEKQCSELALEKYWQLRELSEKSTRDTVPTINQEVGRKEFS